MVSVSEATSIIAAHLFAPQAESIRISEAHNKVLAAPLYADRDFPPFNRVAMDGIAIQFDQLKKGQTTFEIEDVAAAGVPQKSLQEKTHCMEVMTGAPLPENTDTVIRYEDLEIKEKRATLLTTAIDAQQNVHTQGQDAKQNQLLLQPGAQLSAAEIALIASVGLTHVSVKSTPRTAILSTGDELVDIGSIPQAHQIRRSNSYALEAGLLSMGCRSQLFHLRDEKEIIKKELSQLLNDHDLIILSGGVSKGKFDYIPEVLEELGVKKHFHRVNQRPGKPFWFGSVGNKTVFALPGNPVSTYLCFYRYIKPWLLKSWGLEEKTEYAFLGSDFQFTPNLTYFLQVRMVNEKGKQMAYPVPGGGSGDFANLKEVNAFLELPEGKDTFQKGEVYPLFYFRSR
ncbi:MAG TPA: molybdopterin molybdenumtransferase MoeA [Cytophagales bacterium]|nr:molybdopterin molybdenumtransferase MoeA [Cytophagales bacterium]